MSELIRADMSRLDEIVTIENECFTPPWSRESMASELASPDGSVFCTLYGGAVTGFAVMHRAGSEAELYQIAVRTGFRRHGAADPLMEAVKGEASKRGLDRIFLEVRSGNAAAIALYLKHGFIKCGMRRDYYDDPKEDAVLMATEV